MINNVDVFIEGKFYEREKFRLIIEAIENKNKIVKQKDEFFCFCITGFLIVENIPIIVFPKNYKKPDSFEDLKREVMILLHVILKYRMEMHHEPEELTLLLGADEKNNDRITTSFELLEDFLANGYLKKTKEMVSSDKAGFCDWNATVNKKVPYIAHGRPLYLNPIRRNTAEDINNILTVIHKAVISESIFLWGWLFNIDETFEEYELPYDRQVVIDFLKNELIGTFVQRNIVVIKKLIGYLESNNGDHDKYSMEIMATPYFNLVWESICGYIYANEYSHLSKWIAQPVWEGPVISKNISQRPDILFVERDKFYILDAKYYDYNKTIPGWHDIVKQLFYKYTIEKKIYESAGITITKFENIFIFPENSDKDFTYLGKCELPEKVDLKT